MCEEKLQPGMEVHGEFIHQSRALLGTAAVAQMLNAEELSLMNVTSLLVIFIRDSSSVLSICATAAVPRSALLWCINSPCTSMPGCTYSEEKALLLRWASVQQLLHPEAPCFCVCALTSSQITQQYSMPQAPTWHTVLASMQWHSSDSFSF